MASKPPRRLYLYGTAEGAGTEAEAEAAAEAEARAAVETAVEAAAAIYSITYQNTCKVFGSILFVQTHSHQKSRLLCSNAPPHFAARAACDRDGSRDRLASRNELAAFILRTLCIERRDRTV